MDKLTIISGCLFLAADIFAIASIANPDWINTGESAGWTTCLIPGTHISMGEACSCCSTKLSFGLHAPLSPPTHTSLFYTTIHIDTTNTVFEN
uniref:Modulator of smoothened n=1 Tax=Mus musculus TaxID=10090 RepID=A0A140LJ52_MOUSE